MDRFYHEVRFNTQRVSETIDEGGCHIPNEVRGFEDCRGLIEGDMIVFRPLGGSWLEVTKDGVVRTFKPDRGDVVEADEP